MYFENAFSCPFYDNSFLDHLSSSSQFHDSAIFFSKITDKKGLNASVCFSAQVKWPSRAFFGFYSISLTSLAANGQQQKNLGTLAGSKRRSRDLLLLFLKREIIADPMRNCGKNRIRLNSLINARHYFLKSELPFYLEFFDIDFLKGRFCYVGRNLIFKIMPCASC